MTTAVRLLSVLAIPFILLSSAANAVPTHFKTVGKLDTFQWAPDTYTTGFQYDVFYYIPKSLPQNAKSLLFMHGGGSSTMTRTGSASVAKFYAEDLITIAEEQKFVLVVPSSSGLNWGGHTSVMIRALAKLMKAELPLDPDSIGLAGHSMGGMGITRNHMYLADQFAFIMPIAAGMDPVHMSDENLFPIFTTPYHHVQGLHDHFEVFVERAKLHSAKMKVLELQIKKKSKFSLDLTDTDHNYDLDQLSGFLEKDFQTKRDLYQRDLYGSFLYANQIITDNNIQYNYTSIDSYFWLKAVRFTPTDKITRSSFDAHISQNEVNVNLNGAHNIKTLRIQLDSRMFNASLPVDIKINSLTVKKFYFPIKVIMQQWKANAGVVQRKGKSFDAYVDIDL